MADSYAPVGTGLLEVELKESWLGLSDACDDVLEKQGKQEEDCWPGERREGPNSANP